MYYFLCYFVPFCTGWPKRSAPVWSGVNCTAVLGSLLLLFILRLVGWGYFFRGHLVHVACKQIISNFVYDLDSVKKKVN